MITNLVYSAQTGQGSGQKAKCVDGRQNQGGMNNYTCSMTQAQNQDDSLSLCPGPENKGKSPQSLKALNVSQLLLSPGRQISGIGEDSC